MTSPIVDSRIVSQLTPMQRKFFISQLSDSELEAMRYEWRLLWARENQLPPPDFASGSKTIWCLMAGRGFGKTRSAAELVRDWVESGEARTIALVAKTPADARDVMIEDKPHGPGSGLLKVCPPWNRPKFEASKRRLTWPNGATATIYSGESPDQLRGPAHDKAWVDELSKFKFPRETWDHLMLGLRIGQHPQVVVSMTPRTIPTVRQILIREDCAVTRGTTYDNRENLPEAFFRQLQIELEGTRLGRQELLAELLDDVEGALWHRGVIDDNRARKCPDVAKLIVAVDPPAKHREAIREGRGGECGIIVAGSLLAHNKELHGYVLEDCSLAGSPSEWASSAVNAYHRHKADKIVAEANQGGEMVEHTLHTIDPSVKVELVHASRGKHIRAEPIASLYDKARIHHVGNFPELEDQMCTWIPGEYSPDRVDALVWAFTDLMLGGQSLWTRLTWGRD